MGMLNTASGLGKTGLATLAYPFAAIGTGVRAGVADMVGAPRPTDTAADAVAAFGASGVDDLKASYNEDVAGLKKAAAGVFGLTPSAPPTVVGQTPAAPAAAPAPAPNSVDALLNKTATTIANTPVDAAPAVPSNKYDDVVAAAAAKSAAAKSAAAASPGIGVNANPTAVPTIAQPTAKPAVPTMNTAIMEQQKNLMAQIAAAQQVVQQGANRDGYKMGDIGKAMQTMRALAPLVASANNLMASNYGVDAGIINHNADNATRTDIANAGNATDMAKTNLTGQYGIAGHQITAQANMALAQQKALLDANMPAGQKAMAEAEIARFRLSNAKTGNIGANLALEGKQDVQQVKSGTTGNLAGVMVNGKLVPLQGEDAAIFNPQPTKKK